MKQILHIFAKDTRRFLPEILITLGMAIAWISIYRHIWLSFPWHGPITAWSVQDGWVFVYLSPLILLGWWLLISRVLLAERLVGDTQFWITRPYEWKSLLAAKAIFIAVYVYLPILAVHCIGIAVEGFHPQLYIPGLLYQLLLVTAVVLPLAAIASISSNFVRMTLTLLGAAFCLAIAAELPASLIAGRIARPINIEISDVILFLFCGAAVIMQYALRKTWCSRLLLIAIPALICTVGFIDPDRLLMNYNYPLPTHDAPAPVQYSSNPDAASATTYSMRVANHVGIRFLLRVSGIEDGSGIEDNAARVSIEAPDGFRWTSSWQSQS